MASRFLYRRGATARVNAAVITAQAVEISDLVGLSSGNVYRASDHPWGATALSGAQYNFCQNFLGASGQAKAAGVTKAHGANAANRIGVNALGVYEFDCFATALEIGDIVGPASDSAGSSLENQKVHLVTDKTRAIGVVVATNGARSTALVSIFGRKATARALDET